MGWMKLLATAVILLHSAEGFCQGIPWDITLSKFTAASDKVILKRIETYIDHYGVISGEVTNNTNI